MSTHVENLRERYLALVEAMVAGTICEDKPLPVFGSEKYDRRVREQGLDWPSTAFTMVGVKRLRNFRNMIELVIRDNVPGDIIEAGVWRGGACILARAVLEAYNVKNRRVILADSFEGLPPPNEQAFPADANSIFHTYEDLAVSIEQVKRNIAKFGLLDEQVVFLKGWFKDTMPSAPVEKLAVIRLDGDMYESTIDPLNHLWEKLSVGGWIVVDDYEMIPACKAAVNDFLAARGLSPEIYPIDGVGVYFRKGKVAATTGHSVAFDRWSDRAQWTDDSTLRTANFEFSCSVSQYGCETMDARSTTVI